MSVDAPAVIGLDIGTSAVKGVLVGSGGRVGVTVSRSHRHVLGPGGRVEVDPRHVTTGAHAVIAALAARARDAGLRVRALCAGGSGDEAVWLDAAGDPVALVPLSLDTRSASDGEALAGVVGRDWFVSTTGLPPSGAYPIVRMRWLARERPDLASRVCRLLAWPEYVAFGLGVEVAAEPTLAARSGAGRLDPRRDGPYDARILAAAEIDPAVLPPVVPTGTLLGTIPRAIAADLGLPGEVAVVAGGFDQAMATLGAGILAPGVAHVGAGSWEALTVLSARWPDRDLIDAGFTTGPSIGAGGAWSLMASVPGAAALGWWGRIGSGDPRSAGRRAFTLAALAPEVPTGLLAIPDLASSGERAPDGRIGGAIAGLGIGDGPERIGRALLEGVAFALAARLDRLAARGLSVIELRVSGGGARDRRWLRLKADVTGLPVRAVRPGDAGTAAAAAVAAAAIGLAPDLGAALSAATALGPPIQPRPEVHAAYRAQAERAAALRSALGAVQPGDPDA